MSARYSVIQYVPDPVSNERINFGVIAWDQSGARARFLRSNSRLRSFGGEDITFLREFASRIESATSDNLQLPGIVGEPAISVDDLQKMIGNWRHSIQFTEPRGSLKSAAEVLDEVVPIFLRDRRLVPSSAPRTRRTAAKLATQQIFNVVTKGGVQEPEKIVKVNHVIKGKVEEHKFDVVLANGKPLAAMNALSFEVQEGKSLDREIDALAWALVDAQKRNQNLALAVFALPPEGSSPAYDRASRVFKSLNVQLVTEEEKVAKWARKHARTLAAHL